MPLTTPSQQTDIRLLSLTRDIAAHLTAAATKANAQVDAILALDDAELTAWLQGKGQDLNALLTRHATTGAAINAALADVAATLAESGEDAPTASVDIRPLTVKLADQNRQIDLATLTVSDIPAPEE